MFGVGMMGTYGNKTMVRNRTKEVLKMITLKGEKEKLINVKIKKMNSGRGEQVVILSHNIKNNDNLQVGFTDESGNEHILVLENFIIKGDYKDIELEIHKENNDFKIMWKRLD